MRSPLWAILDLAYHTGRRINAILGLKRDDLLLNPTPTMPFGAIRWRAELDKMGKEWVVPMSREVRAVIDRLLVERPLIGPAYLFEAPNHPGTPIAKEVASAWLINAEQLAGVEKHQGSLWHAYRRGWATARKHMPDVDVAAAGGWSDLSSLKTCYQHADEATMFAVVSQPKPLREVRG
jgi:integrase